MTDRSKVLDQIKLVPDGNMMGQVATYVYLQDVIEEGIRSTFGMKQKDAMLLRLAYDLRIALELADKSDEQFKTIKGLQLENGRLKKRIEKLEDDLAISEANFAESVDRHLKDQEIIKELRREQDKTQDTEDRADTGPTA